MSKKKASKTTAERIAAIRSRNLGVGQRTLASQIYELEFKRGSTDREDAAGIGLSYAALYNRIRRFDGSFSKFKIGDRVKIATNGEKYEGTSAFDNMWASKMDDAVGQVGTVMFVDHFGVQMDFDSGSAVLGYSYPPQCLRKLRANALAA